MSQKVAYVTGGMGGIGTAICQRMHKEGFKVIAGCGPSRDFTKWLDEQKALGYTFYASVGNVADWDSTVEAFSKAVAEHGPIDVLVNNAGIFKAADFLDVTEADFDAVLRVNLKGSFLVGQAAARPMAAAGRGAIVNMSSVNGTLAIPTIASYNVSKGGINQLTRVMALALADKGVRVNAVAPGTIATELAAKAVLTSDEARARILSRTPMKRLGEPAEVADVVAWLASDAASYVTGEIVTVDGGRMTLNYTMPV